jgi:hypothetical protein
MKNICETQSCRLELLRFRHLENQKGADEDVCCPHTGQMLTIASALIVE